MTRLTVTDHSRDSAGLTYVYPVVSRRSGGVSIGINLNPNNACNWQCVYCQVPNLIRGAAPEVDVYRLEDELRGLLEEVASGEFFSRYEAPMGQCAIRDIALSGNGEPTSCAQFGAVVGVIGQVCADFELFGRIKRVLISNGSLMHKPEVQRGLAHWAELGGEVWFKLDSATEGGRERINHVHLTNETVRRNLEACARLCPTWLQTCLFACDGQPPPAAEQNAYLEFLAGLKADGIAIEGVLLYGLARPSLQPEAARLSALPGEWLRAFAERIEAQGFAARVHR
jgi:wyosine [tRNA(Phe)-imidazoG37] synthetase (radical SAM superfamily)